MAIDAKKHTTVAAGETPSRAAIAAAILSINDVVPVANATEATQVAQAVSAAGQTLSSSPLVVIRSDAPAGHQIEYTHDPTGAVWMPASGVLHFTSVATRDTWTTSNSGLLTAGDRCIAGVAEFSWNGTRWLRVPRAQAAGVATINATGITQVDFPANVFSVPPIVVITATHSSNLVVPRLLEGSITTARFNAQVFTSAGGQVAGQVYWQAIQMTPTTAEG